MFHSIDVLVAKEINLSFAKFLWKIFVDPYNLFSDIFHVRYYKKIGRNFPFTGKIAFFPKISGFNNLSSPKRMILKFRQYLSN